MSEFTIVMRRCDVTGEEAPADSEKIERVPFSFEGVDYDIDLASPAAAALRETFDPYIAHGRRTGRARGSRTNGHRPTTKTAATRASTPTPASPPSRATERRDPEQTRAIRRWAREVGYQISDRGRIAQPIAEHYREAGGRTAGVTPRGTGQAIATAAG